MNISDRILKLCLKGNHKVDWKIFIISFVMCNAGWWMNELVRYIRNKPKRKKKNYVFLVTVCCQGRI